jgi:hypothetical protein
MQLMQKMKIGDVKCNRSQYQVHLLKGQTPCMRVPDLNI